LADRYVIVDTIFILGVQLCLSIHTLSFIIILIALYLLVKMLIIGTLFIVILFYF